ncbi:MAG: DMT family transporter [Proteobacteria bacterium]|nr:DMT family transporter [Pseudomonadota bacterium]
MIRAADKPGDQRLPERVTARLARILTDAPTTAASNLRGIAFMVTACASFGCGDTIMKLSSTKVPTSELLFLRGSFVTLGGFLVAYWLGALPILHRALSRAMALRAAGDIGGAWSFQTALAKVPYADLTAVGQLIPLSITAFSALFLGEKVGWRRWTATVVGLLGVLLIIRPGSTAFNWWTLFGLLSVLGSTLRDLATRSVDRGVPPAMIMMLSAAGTTLSSLLAAPFAHWQAPPLSLVAAMFFAAMFSLIGQMCIIISVRTADISSVAPFRYSIILFSILSGILVFSQWPDFWTLAGTAIVVSAGLYTFHREQTLRIRARRLSS